MQTRQDRQSETGNSTKLISSVLAGMASNCVTHPLTVLSHHCVVSKRDTIIDRRNIQKPFAGFGAALVYGPVISGAFYFLQDYFSTSVTPIVKQRYSLNDYQAMALSFVPVGITYGFTVSAIMAVQRQVWQGVHPGFYGAMGVMYREAGIKPFFRGWKLGLTGGISFTATYQSVRYALGYSDHADTEYTQALIQNAAASLAASTVNAPFSYLRMQQQITPPKEKTPGIREIMTRFYHETRGKQGFLKRFGYFCRQIDIAPSIYRNAIGVLVGQVAYDYIKKNMRT